MIRLTARRKISIDNDVHIDYEPEFGVKNSLNCLIQDIYLREYGK